MFSKVAFFALLVATAHASGGYSSFSYGVSDPNTGDIKDQQENRVGGNVVGKYSLLESDGTKRIVEYSADDVNGFKAVVHKEPVGGFGAAGFGGALGHPGAFTGNFAHGSLAGAGQIAPLAGASPLAHGALTNSLSHNALAVPHSYGAVSNPHAYGNAAGLAGNAGLYNNYASPLGSPLSYAGRSAPTVSSYSHSIAHNGPDSYPNGGAYGRYGANNYGRFEAHGAPLAGTALAQAHPWAATAGLTHGTVSAAANPWASSTRTTNGVLSPLASSAHGGFANGIKYGNRLGW